MAHGRKEIVEGPEFEDMKMLEFPSFGDAEASCHNPGYQAVCELRFKGGDCRAVIVEQAENGRIER